MEERGEGANKFCLDLIFAITLRYHLYCIVCFVSLHCSTVYTFWNFNEHCSFSLWAISRMQLKQKKSYSTTEIICMCTVFHVVIHAFSLYAGGGAMGVTFWNRAEVPVADPPDVSVPYPPFW